ncbi:unnamed protein product [Amoebophrya sp. A120]|nr:unnamed protein product [Amoebophrya sp. A120]|eukprot:GSA120T00018174001.1
MSSAASSSSSTSSGASAMNGKPIVHDPADGKGKATEWVPASVEVVWWAFIWWLDIWCEHFRELLGDETRHDDEKTQSEASPDENILTIPVFHRENPFSPGVEGPGRTTYAIVTASKAAVRSWARKHGKQEGAGQAWTNLMRLVNQVASGSGTRLVRGSEEAWKDRCRVCLVLAQCASPVFYAELVDTFAGTSAVTASEFVEKAKALLLRDGAAEAYKRAERLATRRPETLSEGFADDWAMCFEKLEEHAELLRKEFIIINEIGEESRHQIDRAAFYRACLQCRGDFGASKLFLLVLESYKHAGVSKIIPAAICQRNYAPLTCGSAPKRFAQWTADNLEFSDFACDPDSRLLAHRAYYDKRLRSVITSVYLRVVSSAKDGKRLHARKIFGDRLWTSVHDITLYVHWLGEFVHWWFYAMDGNVVQVEKEQFSELVIQAPPCSTARRTKAKLIKRKEKMYGEKSNGVPDSIVSNCKGRGQKPTSATNGNKTTDRQGTIAEKRVKKRAATGTEESVDPLSAAFASLSDPTASKRARKATANRSLVKDDGSSCSSTSSLLTTPKERTPLESSSADATSTAVADNPAREPPSDNTLHSILDDVFSDADAASAEDGVQDRGRVAQKKLRQTQVAGTDATLSRSAAFGATCHYSIGCSMTRDTTKLITSAGRRACLELTDFMNARRREIQQLSLSTAPGGPCANDSEEKSLFTYSSINVHLNAKTLPHIDGGNLGESVLASEGNFSGGGLFIHDAALGLGDIDANLPLVHEPVDYRSVAVEVSTEIVTSNAEKRRLFGKDIEKWPEIHDIKEIKSKKKGKKKNTQPNAAVVPTLRRGARFFIIGREFSTKGKLVQFNAARNVHATMPWTGDRYAVIFFTHSSLPGLRNRRGQGVNTFRAFLLALQEMGFPLPEAHSPSWQQISDAAAEVIDLVSSCDEDQ